MGKNRKCIMIRILSNWNAKKFNGLEMDKLIAFINYKNQYMYQSFSIFTHTTIQCISEYIFFKILFGNNVWDHQYERKPKFPLKSWKYVEVHSNWNNDRISQFRKMEFLRHYFKNWLQLSFWDRYSFAIILCFFE